MNVPGVVAIDLGGSGSRGRWSPLAEADTPPLRVDVTGPGMEVDGSGLRPERALAELLTSLALNARGRDVRAVGVGSTGLLTLASGPHTVAAAIGDDLPGVPVVVASDAVTSTLGALAGEPGSVVLAGTGATALGTDLQRHWHKVDGWGHVVGDAGSGSWIGARALALALEQYDGRRADATEMLDAATARYGPPDSWPRQIYTRADRAGVLAAFTPDVATLAQTGDRIAVDLLTSAGLELARTLAAAAAPPTPPLASFVGGVFSAGGALMETFRTEFGRLRPDTKLIEPAGTALDGAEHLARRAARGEQASMPPLVTVVG